MKLYKCITGAMKSTYGNHTWEIGKWYSVDGKIRLYENGFHASKNIIDAMKYVPPGYVCEVEVRGDNVSGDEKQAWREMKIISAYKWTKEDSVRLAVYAAELVVDFFEEMNPENNGPRQAIEAAKSWLDNPTEENRIAAFPASDVAADSVDAAAHAYYAALAAGDAASHSARDAADAAYYAARAAAKSAYYAARSAAKSAYYAARAARTDYATHAASDAAEKIKTKCHMFVLKEMKGEK